MGITSSLFGIKELRAQAAQTDPEIAQLFDRAEEAVTAQEIGREDLLALHFSLVDARQSLAAVVDSGSVEARGLAAQMEALGPPPGEDGREPEAIEGRRAELESRYAEAYAPVLRADELLRRTDLLIHEIDARIRAEDARNILMRSPSPLVPASWTVAAQDLDRYIRVLRDQLQIRQGIVARSERQDGLPLRFALLVATAAMLLALLRPLATGPLRRAYFSRRTRAGRWSVVVATNLLRLIVPSVAVFLIFVAVAAMETIPFSLRSISAGLLFGGLILVVAHWLGHALFAPEQPDLRMLALDGPLAARGLRLCQGIGAIIAIAVILKVMAQDHAFEAATESVVSFPPILVIALLLWSLAGLLRQAGRNDDEAASGAWEEGVADEQLDSGFVWFIVTLMRMTAVLAPVLVLLGFVNLANHAIVPMILTIGILGIALLLYHATIAVARAVSDRRGGTIPPLLPALTILLLALACLPLLALSWGAHGTDLGAIWRALSNGVSLGDARLTLDSVLVLLAVLIVGLTLTRWVQRLLRVSVMSRTRLDQGARSAIVTGFGYFGVIVTALVAVSAAGLDLSSLAVVVGALSVGIGFGLQTIVANFIAGIILLVERPVKEGDWIEVSGVSGIVRKISVRSTRIETFDRHDVIIPNQDLVAGTVTNMTLSTLSGRVIVPVGVAYGSDLAATREILRRAAEMHGQVMSYPEPQVLFMGLGDSSLDFELRCFLRDIGEILIVRSDLLLAIHDGLEEAGIKIPFPQREVHIHDANRVTESPSDASRSET